MADKTQNANENTTDSTGKRGQFDLLNGAPPKDFPASLVISGVYVPAGATLTFSGDQAVDNPLLLAADATLLPSAAGKTIIGPATLPQWYTNLTSVQSVGGDSIIFYGQKCGSL
jgi:hypothetical protein